eukprot:CAMPEP_0185771978 /NCGR_PEP_ID=MMETSP1174-20130828/66314_1 /TAXON_ID=35687 /ORGANISM="Dictyocha speculum, Strain CCMP1381" /LENGTH=53 /DNA_ID=CAMNT_0028458029 /DNA_START=29 /DNA_END=190 /DNA_ORIENTATION=+
MTKFGAKLEIIAEQQDKLLQCMSRLMAQYDDASSVEGEIAVSPTVYPSNGYQA